MCIRGLVWLSGWILVSGSSAAMAGPIEDICGLAYEKLRTVPHHSLKRSTGPFDFDGTPRTGCMVRLDGNQTPLMDEQQPGPLFYPSAGTEVYAQGWRSDERLEADGPDGTSFVIVRGSSRCLVEALWDGGDDSDPSSVPSRDYQMTVACVEQWHAPQTHDGATTSR